MTGPHLRQWCATRDDAELLTVVGPDAEALVRAAAGISGGTVLYRDAERPTEANGYQLHGPWIDAATGLPADVLDEDEAGCE